MLFRTSRWLAAPVAAAALTVAGFAATASASAKPAVKSYTTTAVTAITNRPDSGDHGDWALDGSAKAPLERTASVTLVSEVALPYCGGSTGTGHCYHWTGKISDAGSFTTIIGDNSPGNGSLNGGSAPAIGTAVTGTMAGSYRYDFYSSWKTASKSLVPSKENDAGNLPGGRQTTGDWVAQFFGPGAKFYENDSVSSELGTTGSWTYVAAFGADKACPDQASQWVDGSPGWGADASAGNVLAPDAAHC